MKKRYGLAAFATMFIAASAWALTTQFSGSDNLLFGVTASIADKSLIINTGDGASNPKLTTDDSRNITLNTTGTTSLKSNTLNLGDGLGSDKTLRFDAAGGADPIIRWNNATSKLQFSDNGSTFLNLSSPGEWARTSQTLDYTALASDNIILYDVTTASRTLALPSAVGLDGHVYMVVKTDSSANRVTIDPNGAQTIGGTATQVIGALGNSLMFISDNANWHLIGGRRHVSGYMSFSGAQSITSSFGKIQFSTSERDTVGTINDTTNERFTAPYAGRYRIHWIMNMTAGNATDYRMQFEVQRTGATRWTFADSRKSAADASAQTFHYTWEENMAAGDYLELFARWVSIGTDRNYTEGQAYFEKID